MDILTFHWPSFALGFAVPVVAALGWLWLLCSQGRAEDEEMR